MKDEDLQTVEECDARLRFLTDLAAHLGLPVKGLDELLDRRNALVGCGTPNPNYEE